MPLSEQETTTRELEDTFAKVLRDTVFNGEDLVLIEPYNGPRPQVAYATVHLLTGKGYQHEIRRYFVDGDGNYKEHIKATHWCRVIFQFNGGDAFGNAIKARNKFHSARRQFDLFKTVGMGQISEVMSIPEPYQAKIENRARFTIDFYAMLSDYNDAADIGKVQGSVNGEVPFIVEYDGVN